MTLFDIAVDPPALWAEQRGRRKALQVFILVAACTKGKRCRTKLNGPLMRPIFAWLDTRNIGFAALLCAGMRTCRNRCDGREPTSVFN